MGRAIVIVMDGCGAGAAPDAAEFGDSQDSATILHVVSQRSEIVLPNLADCGFLRACKVNRPATGIRGFGSRYGRLRELSRGGKDSVTGHWEMVGIVTLDRFPTYPNGFSKELVSKIEHAIGAKTLGNRPASGTEIIAELGPEHLRTGYPIVYTSADSVLQIACHQDIVPLELLYKMCKSARTVLVYPDSIQRVIARPFTGSAQEGFFRSEGRRDFPLIPPPNLCDEIGDVFGIGVVPELFGGRGFRKVKRTQNNAEHAEMLVEALNSDAKFIWANFEDFDMLYGHRNDVSGFANCLSNFDHFLGQLLSRLQSDDVLILSADHGNDPTSPSTDHTREFVPFVAIGRSLQDCALGDVEGMTAVGASVAQHLNIRWSIGTPLLGA